MHGVARGSIGGVDALDLQAQRDVKKALHNICTIVGHGVRIAVVSVPPQHIGLGSKTALLLAVVKAACAVTDHDLAIKSFRD